MVDAVSVRYEWTDEQLVRSYRLYHKVKPRSPMQWTLLLYCLAAWACGIYFWNLTGSIGFLVFMVLAGVAPMIVKGPMRRRLELIGQRRRLQAGQTLEFTVGEDGIALGSGAWTWDQVHRAGVSLEGIVLVMHPNQYQNQYVWLPDDGFANAADRARVEGWWRARRT